LGVVGLEVGTTGAGRSRDSWSAMKQ